MASRKKHWKAGKKFGIAGGKHASRKKCKKSDAPRYRYKVTVPISNSNNIKLKVLRRRIVRSYRNMTRNFIRNIQPQYRSQLLSSDGNVGLRIRRLKNVNVKGYRMINLDCLETHMSHITMHVALCDRAKKLVKSGKTPVSIVSEVRTFGLASVLLCKCHGCGCSFKFETSPKLPTRSTCRYDVNVRAVWGCTVTGNGSSHLNEIMGTLDSPGMTQTTFTNIEQNIGDWWEEIMKRELLEAGAEERRIAIEKGNFDHGVPFITVIADWGWSKRSHKHSYNALGGVGIIIGKETGKILHLGVRNKYCYICSRAQSQHVISKPHTCYGNWKESSQAMEADVIVEGFKKAERMHGLRYLRLVADGDSSVFAKIQEEVPIWGKDVSKVECANHVCKCLRSSLEKLVEDNKLYKGKDKLTKATRIRIVSAVRCAIRIRSREIDKNKASKILAHDIRNCIYHIFGEHKNCSDFCKANKQNAVSSVDNDSLHVSEDFLSSESSPDSVCREQELLWTEGSSIEAQEESRFVSKLSFVDLDNNIQQDVSLLLNRVASKSTRLIDNFTTNLAEAWMHIRSKFDGGKLFNICSRGSWHTRCYGGSLRMNLGPQWSPSVWQDVTGTPPGYHFTKLYTQREQQLKSCNKSKKRPECSVARWKRKIATTKESNSKKARLSYGKDAVDVVADLTEHNLEKAKESFLHKHINISNDRLLAIERLTKDQSSSSTWVEERKKRLTASVFGSVVKRNPKIPVAPLVRQLLYKKFKGNQYTRLGLQNERITLHEYILKKAENEVNVDVFPMGLVINSDVKFLGGSPDGKVVEKDGTTGLIEVKNLLLTKPINLTQAAKSVKTFCLEINTSNQKLSLKKSHDYYYQCQGLLNVTGLPWLDFVVRTVNPYQLHIQRILKDEPFWNNIMLPKLCAFYEKVLLPELSVPREGKSPGIREPGVWFEDILKPTRQKKGKTGENKKQKSRQSANNPKSDNKETASISAASVHVETPSTSSADHTQSAPTRRKVRGKTKFVGRRVIHEWKVEGKSKWYKGTVLSCLRGCDGDDQAVYEILYDREDEPHEVDHLHQDYVESSVQFIDL